jgi:hypothetical protein
MSLIIKATFAAIVSLTVLAFGTASAGSGGAVEAGMSFDLKCEHCDDSTGDGRVDATSTSLFAALSGGDVRVQFGFRWTRIGQRKSVWVDRESEWETMWSTLVYYDPGRFAIGLGMHRSQQFVKPFFEIEGTVPALAIRIGRTDALSAYVSFGELGDAVESSGQFNMGLRYVLPDVFGAWAGVAADLTPVAANEAGAEYLGFSWLRIGGRIAADLPDATGFMFVGLFAAYRDDVPALRRYLDPSVSP